MSHYLNKTAVYFLFGSAALVGAAALTVLIDKPTAYGAGCGEDCRNENYQVTIPIAPVCRTDTVPVTHYYNTTRPVKQYYSYEVSDPGACRSVSGWTCGQRNRWGACVKKNYYNRQVCEPDRSRTVSGWRWVDEPITASYVTWESRQVCSQASSRSETRTRQVCTPRACPVPAPTPSPTPAPTPAPSQGSRCFLPNETTVCLQPDWQGKEYHTCKFRWSTLKKEWGPTLACGGENQYCSDNNDTAATCAPKPAVSNTGRDVGAGCYSLSVAYGTGYGAPTQITIGEGAKYYLRWEPKECPRPQDCNKWGTWSGNANVGGGTVEGPKLSGTAASAYNEGYHNFQLGCRWAGDPNYYKASNVVSVRYEVKQSTPPPVTTCKTNECSPNQCWNSGQTRSCVKDEKTGNYCWGERIISCTPGSHCGGGQCVNNETGQPQTPPETTTPPPGTPLPGTECRPGIDAACTPPGGCTSGTSGCPTTCTIGVDCPSGVVPPGAGDGGGPAYGSTQCYDGEDNDLDGKMDGADSGCLDSSGAWSKSDNSEFNFRIKEIIPDFFNLNWFKLNVANFLRVEALGKE